MSDGTNDRGPKPPRTLFSLGRPGAKPAEEPVAVVEDAPAADLTDTVDAAGTVDPTEVQAAPDEVAIADASDDTFSGYLCGACEAPLPIGAVFCAECGTPVAGIDDVAESEPEAAAEAEAEAETDVGAGAAAPAAAVAATAAATAAASDESLADEFAEEVVYEGEPVLDLTSAYESSPAASATLPPNVEAEAPAAQAAADADLAQPAAVLYADPSHAEPLPAKPEGSWGISEPAFGSSEGDFVSGERDDAEAQVGDAAWAAPTAEVAAVGAAGTIAPDGPPPANLAGTTAASMPYGHGPVESSEKKSKSGLIIGVAAAAVLVLVIGGIALAASGSKDNGGNLSASQATNSTTNTTAAGTGGNTTTTKDPKADSTTSTSERTSTTKAATTTSSETTPTSEATTTSAATTPTFTVTPPTVRPTVAPTTPPTTIAPGRISPIPANGQSITIPKGGSTQVILQNVGGLPASCTISVSKGNLSLNQNCSPSIQPGGSITITVRANPGFEGAGQISGLMEGVGSYTLNIFVNNG